MASAGNFGYDLNFEGLPENSEGGGTTNQLLDKIETDDSAFEQIVQFLLDDVAVGHYESLFQLGQVHFKRKMFEKARGYFDRVKKIDPQARYQLGVMYYDGLGLQTPDHRKGFENMLKVIDAVSDDTENKLRSHACFNIGLAYFQGFGVQRRSDVEAEKWWLESAKDGSKEGCVKAQSVLGLFYSSVQDYLDLEKAFIWHNEATGNGSLESQGCLGVMYERGLGVKQDLKSAFRIFREAGERANVYAMGNLVQLYFKSKMYTKCVELAFRISEINEDEVRTIANETDCVCTFVRKGVALALFYFAICLLRGLGGLMKDEKEAYAKFSKCYNLDADTCAALQRLTQQGYI